MKTDALYLSLFETTPSLALRLAGCPLARASEYTCQSQEFKRTFRVDAVLLPPSFSLPLLLIEVQFQRDTDIYHRLVASGAIARIQYAEYADIRMVLLFASRSVDAGAGVWQPLVDAGVVQVVYLDEATARIPLEHCTVAEQASLLLARVTVSPFDRALDDRCAEEFGRILAPLRGGSSGEVLLYKAFKDFFVNLYLSKYKSITFEEIAAMIDSIAIFDDIGESRAVQEYAEKAVHSSKQATVRDLLSGGLSVEYIANVLHLPLEFVQSVADIAVSQQSSGL